MKNANQAQFDFGYLIYALIASAIILFCAWIISESSILFDKYNSFKTSTQEYQKVSNNSLYQTSQELINITLRKQANFKTFNKANQRIQEI